MSQILFINMYIAPSVGGVEKVMDTLCDLFINHGHSVYCATDSTAYIPEEIHYCDVCTQWSELIVFIKRHNIDIVINYAAHDIRFVHIITQLRQELPKIKIISALHNDPQFLDANLKSSLSIKNFRTFKGSVRTLIRYAILPVYYYRSKQRATYVYRQTYQSSDWVVLLSERYRHSFVCIAGINSSDKIKAIPNPIVAHEDSYFIEKKQTVLIVSRLATIKRIDIALQIWCELNKKHSDVAQWKLRIVGSGHEQARLQRIALKNNLTNVVFVGFQNNPITEYNSASIFMMTSLYEGFGLTLVEAQMSGVVPIAFDSYATLHDIITNGENGVIVENNNINQYVNELHCLMQNREICTTLAKNGLATSKQYLPNHIYNTYWKELLCNK